MDTAKQIARHLRELYTGGNWTDVNLRDKVQELAWTEATAEVDEFHSIAALVFHIDYFVCAMLKVLNGGPLDAKDKFSFDLDPIQDQDGWNSLLSDVLKHAEELATLVEPLSDEQLAADFADGKYGSVYRNLQGLIEHGHYHLGQIAVLMRFVRQDST